MCVVLHKYLDLKAVLFIPIRIFCLRLRNITYAFFSHYISSSNYTQIFSISLTILPTEYLPILILGLKTIFTESSNYLSPNLFPLPLNTVIIRI